MIATQNVCWLEQSESDVPAEEQWLCPRERLCLSGLRFAKRRTDWRLGRWTAKLAVAFCLDLPTDTSSLAKLQIRAAASGAPEAFLHNERAAVTISLSHRSGIAMCVVADAPAALGCDLELIEPRSASFVTDYFTLSEQELI